MKAGPDVSVVLVHGRRDGGPALSRRRQGEAVTWVRSLTTTAPPRSSTGRWVAVGSGVVGVWTAPAGGALAVLGAVSP